MPQKSRENHRGIQQKKRLGIELIPRRECLRAYGCACLCVGVCASTCRQAYRRVYVRVPGCALHVRVCVCVRAPRVYVRTCMRVCVYTCRCVCVYVYAPCVPVRMPVSVPVCVYGYADTCLYACVASMQAYAWMPVCTRVCIRACVRMCHYSSGASSMPASLNSSSTCGA